MEERFYRRPDGSLVRAAAWLSYRTIPPSWVCLAEDEFDDLTRITREEYEAAVKMKRLREEVAAAVLAEREACAKIADGYAERAFGAQYPIDEAGVAARHIAGYIRARSNELHDKPDF